MTAVQQAMSTNSTFLLPKSQKLQACFDLLSHGYISETNVMLNKLNTSSLRDHRYQRGAVRAASMRQLKIYSGITAVP